MSCYIEYEDRCCLIDFRICLANSLVSNVIFFEEISIRLFLHACELQVSNRIFALYKGVY